MTELLDKQNKLKQLQELIYQFTIEDKVCNEILFFLGQNYIFGIQGKGLTKKELTNLTKTSIYVVTKAIEELKERQHIEFLKRNPVELTLAELLRSKMDD